MADGCKSASGARCPKPPLPRLDVCGWHQVKPDGSPDTEAVAAFAKIQNPIASAASVRARRRRNRPAIPAGDDLLDTREKVIGYISSYAHDKKHANAAARVAATAIQALNTPELKALEKENERLRQIIVKFLPQARPILDGLRAVK